MTYGIYFAEVKTMEKLYLVKIIQKKNHMCYGLRLLTLLILTFYSDTGYGEIIPTITDQEDDLINIEPVKIEIFSAKSISEDGVNKILIERYLQTDFTITENSFPVRNSLTTLFHEKTS